VRGRSICTLYRVVESAELLTQEAQRREVGRRYANRIIGVPRLTYAEHLALQARRLFSAEFARLEDGLRVGARGGDLRDLVVDGVRENVLVAKRLIGDIDARIPCKRDRTLVARAADGETYRILPGRCERPVVTSCREIPNETMRAGISVDGHRLRNPTRCDLLGGRIDDVWLISARVTAKHRPARADDLDNNRRRRCAAQVVIDVHTDRRIRRLRLLRLNRRPFVAGAPEAISHPRREQVIAAVAHRARHFAQRCDVVHDPFGAAVRADHEVAGVHVDIAYRRDRQIALQ
jgi:hypothetical protein